MDLEVKRYMLDLFNNGLIGTKEFRNWLASVDPNFEKIRDTSVDDEIDRVAREVSKPNTLSEDAPPPPWRDEDS